jgi:helix-turn-helix protein
MQRLVTSGVSIQKRRARLVHLLCRSMKQLIELFPAFKFHCDDFCKQLRREADGRTETTLEAHEIWVIKRSRRKAALWCKQCAEDTERLTPEEAAKLMNVSTRTIYRWAEAERIHFTFDLSLVVPPEDA